MKSDRQIGGFARTWPRESRKFPYVVSMFSYFGLWGICVLLYNVHRIPSFLHYAISFVAAVNVTPEITQGGGRAPIVHYSRTQTTIIISTKNMETTYIAFIDFRGPIRGGPPLYRADFIRAVRRARG